MNFDGEKRNYTAYTQLVVDAFKRFRLYDKPDSLQYGLRFGERDLPFIANIVDNILDTLASSADSHVKRQEEVISFRYPLRLSRDYSGVEKATNPYSMIAEVLPRYSQSKTTTTEGFGIDRSRSRELAEEGLVRVATGLRKNSAFRQFISQE